MKKLYALMLALVMMMSTGLTIAFADQYPANVNPQQRGHVAYLDATYGTKKADTILNGYGRPSTQKTPEIYTYVPPQPINTGVIIIPQPSTNTPVWGNLQVGQGFTVNGQNYIVGRFSYVANARVLVAYPVQWNGVIDYAQPRYFYI